MREHVVDLVDERFHPAFFDDMTYVKTIVTLATMAEGRESTVRHYDVYYREDGGWLAQFGPEEPDYLSGAWLEQLVDSPSMINREILKVILRHLRPKS